MCDMVLQNLALEHIVKEIITVKVIDGDVAMHTDISAQGE